MYSVFSVSSTADEVILSRFVDRETYESSPNWTSKTGFDIQFLGIPFVVNTVEIDGQSVDFEAVANVCRVRVEGVFNEIVLVK